MFSLGIIFHILLIGKSLFSGKTYNDILTQNRQSNIKLEGPEYLSIPKSAFELLKRMLEKEPKKRITSGEAVKSEFFMDKKKDDDLLDDDISDENVDGGMEQNLQKFN